MTAPHAVTLADVVAVGRVADAIRALPADLARHPGAQATRTAVRAASGVAVSRDALVELARAILTTTAECDNSTHARPAAQARDRPGTETPEGARSMAPPGVHNPSGGRAWPTRERAISTRPEQRPTVARGADTRQAGVARDHSAASE